MVLSFNSLMVKILKKPSDRFVCSVFYAYLCTLKYAFISVKHCIWEKPRFKKW